MSGTQVGKPRPVGADLSQDAVPIRARRMPFIAFAFWSIVVLAAAGTAFMFRGKIMDLVKRRTLSTSKAQQKALAKGTHQIPTNFSWTMNLSNVTIPEKTASGGIRGIGFLCEHAVLQGGNLTLVQGNQWPPDLGVSVHLFAKEGQELSGKTIQVGPERQPPLPKIVLRWKDEQDRNRKQDYVGGYALKMIFGDAVDSRMPGKLFLSLPDEEKSFVAGTFDAEIRKPPPPKPPKSAGTASQ